MIVSSSRNFIFVHIAKTAGTAARRAISVLLDPTQDANTDAWVASGEAIPRAWLNPEIKMMKHSTATRIRNAVGPDNYRDAYKFAFVRNPFARAYSGAAWLRQQAINNRENPEAKLVLPEDLRRYADIPVHEILEEIDDLSRKRLALFPQVHWLPKKGMMSFIGRTEYFSDDLARIWGVIAPDVPVAETFGKENVSARSSDWRSMTGATCDKIRVLYADDFERFGYSTDLDAPMPPPYPIQPAKTEGHADPVPFRV